MDLLRNIQPNTTLLTPNRRLSAVILKQYNAMQIADGKTVWHSLDILPITSWLRRLWHTWAIQQNTASHVLSDQEEQILWEEILSQSPEHEYLLQLASTADIVKSAWGILKQWQVDIQHPDLSITDDGAAFQKWGIQFQAMCQKNNWLDTHSIGYQVTEKICAQEILPEKNIILLGFTELSPFYQHLLNQCTQIGSHIIHQQTSVCTNTIKRISLSDEETEIHSMGRWAKALLTDKKTTTPLSIGCVIPHLDTLRDKVIHIFSEIFSTENAYTLDHTTLPFNISAGQKLNNYPVIHAALQLLNLQIEKIPLEIFSNILRSPFIGAAEHEMLNRAHFDSLLRNHNITTLSLKKLLTADFELCLTKYCPVLAKHIENYLALITETKAVLPVSKWVNLFMQLLNALGWPGERSLNSKEYQVVQEWLDLLSKYMTFDTVLGPQSYTKAVHYLTRLIAKTIFQPQSPDAPVQVLGILEAADIPFDYLWVMGLDDTTWPPAPKPNPFIPQQLQKKLHMPHATAERELLYCQHLTHQLKQGANNIIFSHALKNNESELRPSSLMNDIPNITIDNLTLSDHTSSAERIYQSRQICLLTDEWAPPLPVSNQIRGGISILKQQAACPFKAFAEFRLHAQTLASPSLGLRPQDRGTLIHKALELVWKILQNHDTLVKYSEEELQHIIQQCVAKSIAATVDKNSTNTRYLALEALRLQKLIWDWLALEKSRPPFAVVACEQATNVTIGSLPLSIRIDRIDVIANGDTLIIDYKTGKSNHISSWFSERPDEPQLPLYCVINSKNTTGLAFAQIHRADMDLKGISKKTLEIKSIKPLSEVSYTNVHSWQQQIQQWQTVLEELAASFCKGNAKVDPKKAETCQHCHLQPLCRIYE